MSNDNRIGHTNGNFNVGLNLTKAKMDRILPAEQIKSCLWTKLACGLFLIGESGTYKSLTSLDDELLGSENFLLTTYMSRIFPCSNQGEDPHKHLKEFHVVYLTMKL
ncbi:hypothetical protein NC652_018769 [Populus alba x Populus x berolinensis]|nr:hypothetical protein NC652_018769 [Populus alba x Populus x berolinensis]